MLLVPDDRLFRHAPGRGMTLNEFGKLALDAQDAASLAVLKGEIARVAYDINYLLVPRKLSDFNKKVAMADYLSKQKVTIPVARHYRQKVATGPITSWNVAEELRQWGFEPTLISVSIKKRTRFLSSDCYVVITFSKK